MGGMNDQIEYECLEEDEHEQIIVEFGLVEVMRVDLLWRLFRILGIFLVVLGVVYTVSFWLFIRLHLETGIVGGLTRTYVAVPNTELNRRLVPLYQPLTKRSFPGGSPIIWE
jgi:hypothetical protein